MAWVDVTGDTYVASYRAQGFAVLRGVFGAAEIAELATAFDRLYLRALSHRRSFRHQNVYYQLSDDPRLGRIVRYIQWPAYVDPVFERFRTDQRLFEILAPLLGRDQKQIINQLHWKPPGAQSTDFGYHQDIQFRHPASAYRDPGHSYVQTAIAVDPHRRENGTLRVYPGSHGLGRLDFGRNGRVLHCRMDEKELFGLGLDPARLVDLDLDPGDVAFWNPYTIHGSGPNLSTIERRTYLNSYVTAACCDRGEWAWLDGRACPLGAPRIVHYPELYRRGEPHYVNR